MKDTKELQEEFESLIEELERLRSVNEITTENSNNARRTIDEIESFLLAMKEFSAVVSKDYRLKSEKLANLAEKFEDELNKLESNVNEQTSRFELLTTNHTESASEAFENFRKSMDDSFAESERASESFFETVSISIASLENLLKERFDSLSVDRKTNQEAVNSQYNWIVTNLEGVNKKNQKLTLIVIATLILVVISIGVNFVI